MRRLLAGVVTIVAIVMASPAAATAAGASAPGDRLVVTFRSGTSSSQARADLDAAGATELSAIPQLGARVVTAGSGKGAAVAQSLRSRRSVERVEVDGTAVPTLVPNDPYFPTGAGALGGGEWGSAKTQAPQAWDLTTGSASVTIAIIDSGVVATQPDLAPVLVPGWNVLTNTSDTSDTYGHGTEAAGVAVAASNNGQGVAAYCWACGLMPIKVYNSASAYLSDVASGMTWAVDHGAKVLSVSLAGTTPSSVLTSAVSYATSHGAVVVAAAGNNGNSTATYPASIPGVISVAATDQTDTLYSYSDYGSWVDIAAPGSTPTTLPNGAYGAVGGTSIATPAVAGIAGLLFSLAPGATPAAVQNALFTSTDPNFPAGSTVYGRVNAYKALVAIQSAAPGSAPTNTSAPTITGTARSGQTLTAATGAWTGSPTSYGYQWRRCDATGANCAAVGGATATSYAVTSADVGSTITVAVTASNGSGSATASSAPTATVTAGSQSWTFNGNLSKVSSQSFSVTSGSGPASGALSFGKCSSLSLVVKSTAGTVLAQGSGPSVLSVGASLGGGTSNWTVSGSCRTSFALSVTAAAP